MQKATSRLGMERGRDEEQNEQKEEEGQENVGSGAAEQRRKKRRKESGNKRQATLHEEIGHRSRTATATVAGVSFCILLGIPLSASTMSAPGSKRTAEYDARTPQKRISDRVIRFFSRAFFQCLPRESNGPPNMMPEGFSRSATGRQM